MIAFSPICLNSQSWKVVAEGDPFVSFQQKVHLRILVSWVVVAECDQVSQDPVDLKSIEVLSVLVAEYKESYNL